MEKKTRSITALLLCLVMVLSLTACADEHPASPNTEPLQPEYVPESALELWERINETMDALTSMEMTISTQKVYYSAGYQYAHHTQSYVLATKNAHYTESESHLLCEALELEQTIRMVEAFYEGKMYRAVSDGTYDQKFCSEISHEDFDGLQTGGLTAEFALADCTTAVFSKTVANSWQLNFSGYTKKTIDQAMVTLGLSEDMMGASVADMQVTVTTNELFQVTLLDIVFEFASEGESTPVFAVSTVYSGWNTAQFDENRLKEEEYVQVEDVYLLDTISAALQERQNAHIGQFTLETQTTEQYQNQIRSAKEKGVIIYGLKNGAYSYFFTANTEGESFIVRYQNGEQTVISNGQAYTAVTSEAEAKAYINGMIDSANYNPVTITGIEKREDGSYLLTSDRPDLTGSLDEIEIQSASQQIIVTFAEGRLMRIESRLTIEGTFDEEAIKLQTDSSVMFTDIAEFPDL